MQQTLIVGDTLQFTTSVPDYQATDGWTLTYRLVPRTAGAAIQIVASASGADYEVSVPAATTEDWAAGEYSWSAYVELAGQRYTVESGVITLLPNPALVATYDGRSQAQKAVDDLNAALATYTASSGHVSEYTIAGRSMTFRKTSEIIELLNHWQIILQREQAAASTAKGLANPRRYYLRFGRA